MNDNNDNNDKKSLGYRLGQGLSIVIWLCTVLLITGLTARLLYALLTI